MASRNLCKPGRHETLQTNLAVWSMLSLLRLHCVQTPGNAQKKCLCLQLNPFMDAVAMSASADQQVIKHSAVIFTSQAEKSNNGISVVCLRPHAYSHSVNPVCQYTVD